MRLLDIMIVTTPGQIASVAPMVALSQRPFPGAQGRLNDERRSHCERSAANRIQRVNPMRLLAVMRVTSPDATRMHRICQSPKRYSSTHILTYSHTHRFTDSQIHLFTSPSGQQPTANSQKTNP